MSKKIVVRDGKGNVVHTFKSSLFRGVHIVEAKDGFCVMEKELFRNPKTIACFRLDSETGRIFLVSEQEDCLPCSLVNSTQHL